MTKYSSRFFVRFKSWYTYDYKMFLLTGLHLRFKIIWYSSFWTAICNCKALSSSIKFSFVVEVIVPESLFDQIPVVYRLKNLLALYVLDACIYSKSGLQWNVPLNFLTLWICNYFQIIFSFINLGITGTLACCWLVLQSSRSYLN